MEGWKTNSNNSKNSLLYLIKNCEYHDLSEKQSLDTINSKLPKPISRSTYYNYKKNLYQDEMFQSLKRSIYKSKLLKYLLLYFDKNDEPRDMNIRSIILEKFPEKKDIFEITKDQQDKIKRTNKRIQSNFDILDVKNNIYSNLRRVNKLPKKYTLREEYIRCGKNKMGKCKCKSSKHGPYYYAYWREKSSSNTNKSILRKKYLGIIDPRL